MKIPDGYYQVRKYRWVNPKTDKIWFDNEWRKITPDIQLLLTNNLNFRSSTIFIRQCKQHYFTIRAPIPLGYTVVKKGKTQIGDLTFNPFTKTFVTLDYTGVDVTNYICIVRKR